tara:strand:- start:3 stop:1085 length:1083 start_codon:yes stop_codon:yes gene_type:complete
VKKYILLISILTANILFSQTTDVITNINFPGGVITNNDDLFVSDWYNGIVYKYDLDDPNNPVIVADGLTRTYSVRLNGNDLFFCDTEQGIVYKIDITDQNSIKEIVLENLNGPYGVFINNDFLYIANNFGNTISKLDLSDPNATEEVLASNLGGPFDLAVIGNELYFTQRAVGKISKIDLSNPATVIDIITGLTAPSGLAVKNNELYIAEPYIFDTDNLPGRITKIDINDPTPTQTIVYEYPVGSNPFDHYAQHIYIDENTLYIGESYANKIVKVELDILNISEFDNIHEVIQLYPNPANEYIQISGLTENLDYKIYNILGQNILNGETQNMAKIDVHLINNGVYLIRFSNGIIKRFIKK